MANRTRKVSRRAAVAMIGSGLGISNVLVHADDCKPKGDVTLVTEDDPNTHLPQIRANLVCKEMVPLLLAGAGRGRISDVLDCEVKQMLDTLDNLNKKDALRENAFTVFGLTKADAGHLQQNFAKVLTFVRNLPPTNR